MEEEFTIGVSCDDMTAAKYSEASIPSLAALAMRVCASRRDRPLMCASKLEYTVSKISVGRANASGVAASFSTTCLPLGGSRKKSTDDRLLMPSVAVMTRFENISSASSSVSTTAAAAISGGTTRSGTLSLLSTRNETGCKPDLDEEEFVFPWIG